MAQLRRASQSSKQVKKKKLVLKVHVFFLLYLGKYGGTSIQCRANPWQQAPATAAAGCNPARFPIRRISSAKQTPKKKINSLLQKRKLFFFFLQYTPTSGGKQSSAARRGTEKPPCVLVSDAVSVLQNMCGIRANRCFMPSPSSPSPSSARLATSFNPRKRREENSGQKTKKKNKTKRNHQTKCSNCFAQAGAHLLLRDKRELRVHLVGRRVRLQRRTQSQSIPSRRREDENTYDTSIEKGRTRRVTSTTRQKTCGGTAAAAAAAAGASPRCSRCPCGRYTTTPPFLGSGATGPAQACHSSRHTAPALAGAGDEPFAATSSAASSSSSSTVLRSIPVMAGGSDSEVRRGAKHESSGAGEGEGETSDK